VPEGWAMLASTVTGSCDYEQHMLRLLVRWKAPIAKCSRVVGWCRREAVWRSGCRVGGCGSVWSALVWKENAVRGMYSKRGSKGEGTAMWMEAALCTRMAGAGAADTDRTRSVTDLEDQARRPNSGREGRNRLP
jgi:hypothetical protein